MPVGLHGQAPHVDPLAGLLFLVLGTLRVGPGGSLWKRARRTEVAQDWRLALSVLSTVAFYLILYL